VLFPLWLQLFREGEGSVKKRGPAYTSVKSINKAFTLVELLIAASLITIVLAGLWGGISFSGKATKSSMLQSDAMNSADSTFRKLQMFLAACEKIDFPLADNSSGYAVVTDYIGSKWVIALANDRKTVIVSGVEESNTYKLFSTNQTLLKFTKLDFHNLGGKELKLTLSLDNVNGDKIRSLTSFAGVFKVGTVR
jgi:prepilin-type N-terminal cleavage/methylation domain-containing protein